jgi:hypothetical protein
MLSRQEEEQERRETLENDRLVREAEHRRLLREGTTFHQHAQSAANDTGGGRFASSGAPHVTGSSPVPIYPAGPQWTADPGSQVVEPPLSVYENPAIEPSAAAEATGAPAGAAAAAERLPPASAQSDDAGASFSQQDEDQ